MGGCPRWYRVLSAARYLGTTPWEMEKRGWRYVRQAEEAQYAENAARAKHAT